MGHKRSKMHLVQKRLNERIIPTNSPNFKFSPAQAAYRELADETKDLKSMKEQRIRNLVFTNSHDHSTR